MRFQGRLRDLGKLYPYNKLLPQLFDNPAVIGATCNYYDQLAGGCAGCKLFFHTLLHELGVSFCTMIVRAEGLIGWVHRGEDARGQVASRFCVGSQHVSLSFDLPMPGGCIGCSFMLMHMYPSCWVLLLSKGLSLPVVLCQAQ